MKQNLKSYFHRQNTHTYTQLQISTIKCKIIKMVVVMKTNHIRLFINVLAFLNLHTQHIATMPPNIPVDPQYNKQETFPLILMPPFFLLLTHAHTHTHTHLRVSTWGKCLVSHGPAITQSQRKEDLTMVILPGLFTMTHTHQRYYNVLLI